MSMQALGDRVRFWLIDWEEWLIPALCTVLLLGIMGAALIASGADLGASIPEGYTPMGVNTGKCDGQSGVYHRSYGLLGDERVRAIGVMGYDPAVYIHFAPGEEGGIVAVFLVLPGKPVQRFTGMAGLSSVAPTPCDLLRYFPAKQGV